MTERGYLVELTADRSFSRRGVIDVCDALRHPEYLRLLELCLSGEMIQELHHHDGVRVFLFRRAKIEAGESIPWGLGPGRRRRYSQETHLWVEFRR